MLTAFVVVQASSLAANKWFGGSYLFKFPDGRTDGGRLGDGSLDACGR